MLIPQVVEVTEAVKEAKDAKKEVIVELEKGVVCHTPAFSAAQCSDQCCTCVLVE